MREENESRSPPWMAILVGIGACAVLITMLLPSTPEGTLEKSLVITCRNNLKQMGLDINSYYSDSHATLLPILKHFEVCPANDGGFGFDANMLSCRAERHDHSTHYVWNPKLSGGKWADWNNPISPLIWDASPHKFNGKVNVLLGDGHVEELTPVRLTELTR